MQQQYLFDPIPCNKYDLLTKEEVVSLNKANEDLNRQMRTYIAELETELLAGEKKEFLINEQLINIKNKLFGKSSEKSDNKSLKNKKK